ncbi:hypothetical protein LTR53_010539, partial [Teratosphaeriaceae sp. CCFEE 6253]
MPSTDVEDHSKGRLTITEIEDRSGRPLSIISQLRPWLLDIASLLLSLACVLSVVALLVHYDNQPVPTWTIPIVRLRPVTVPGLATIGRTTAFLSSTYDPQGSQLQASILDLPTRGAVYAGLLNLTAYGDVAISCSTGNCTWQPYTSLGFCSACDSLDAKSSIDPTGYGGPTYIWKLPNGANIEASSNSMNFYTGLPVANYGHLRRYTVVNVTSLYFQPFQGNGGVTSEKPSAYECALWFCVKTYSAYVSNGTLVETLVSTFPNASTTPNEAAAAIQPPPGSNGISASPSELIYIRDPQGNFTISPPTDSEQYSINNVSFAVTRRWFQDTIQASVTGTLAPSSQLSDMAQALYQSQLTEGGPAALMDRIATSMTAHTRNATAETAS